MLEIVGLLVKFGPQVVKLILEVCKAIKAAGAETDRAAAERALYKKAWAIKHKIPDEYMTGK